MDPHMIQHNWLTRGPSALDTVCIRKIMCPWYSNLVDCKLAHNPHAWTHMGFVIRTNTGRGRLVLLLKGQQLFN